MSRKVVIDRKALKYVSELPEKSQRIIKEKCHALAEDPLPGKGANKELLHLEFKLYRLHVGRSFTVFYQICDEEDLIRILEIVAIGKHTSSTGTLSSKAVTIPILDEDYSERLYHG